GGGGGWRPRGGPPGGRPGGGGGGRPPASIASRQASPSSRRRLARHSSLLSGSASWLRASRPPPSWYAADSRISRCSALSDQPEATKRVARWSSSSGCVGGSPSLPKLLDVRTSPLPQGCGQARLTLPRGAAG